MDDEQQEVLKQEIAKAAAPRWQDKFAQPNWKDQMTVLGDGQESQFLDWAVKNNVPITEDYDMRGYYIDPQRQNTETNANDGMPHYPDTYKTPLHKSFSGESKYSMKGGPTWNSEDQLVDANGTVLFDERKK